MDRHRFETLAEAYGGDLRRWPEAERAGAQAFRGAAPEAAEAALAAAAELDFALDAWRTPVPSPDLYDRILAAAPRARARAKARAAWKGLGLWLSGAGFAAAAAAGLIFGLAATNAAVSDVRADTVLSATLPDDAGLLSPFTVGAVEGRQA